MGVVIHRTTLVLRKSANTPDFPEPEWKHNPDLSQVDGVEQRYWKWDATNERPVPMTKAESDAVDAAEKTEREDSEIGRLDDLSVESAAILALFDETNNLRSRAGLQPRTLGQFKTAIRQKMRGS